MIKKENAKWEIQEDPLAQLFGPSGNLVCPVNRMPPFILHCLGLDLKLCYQWHVLIMLNYTQKGFELAGNMWWLNTWLWQINDGLSAEQPRSNLKLVDMDILNVSLLHYTWFKRMAHYQAGWSFESAVLEQGKQPSGRHLVMITVSYLCKVRKQDFTL